MTYKKLVLFGLFAFVIFLRLFQPTHYIFNFDQEQIALNATNILNGKLTLIGPKVGPADFFQPPLMYYLAAPFYLFGQGHPVSGTYFSVFLSTASVIVIYFLFKVFESDEKAFAAVFLWSTSMFLLSMDRVTWLINLMAISSFMVYFGLKNLKHRYANLLISTGLFLAFNTHVSSFILLVIALFTFIKNKKNVDDYIKILIFPFMLSLLPLFIFDIRHDFLSAKGLFNFAFNRVGASARSIPYQFFRSTMAAIQIGGRMIIENTSIYTHLIIGGILLIYAKLHQEKTYKLCITWLVAFIAIFGFYGGHLPEYYFLMLMPVFVDIYTSLWMNKGARLLLVLVSIYSMSIGLSKRYDYHLSMQNKIDVIDKITEQAGTNDVLIKLSLPKGGEFGFAYLIDYMNITQNENAPKYILYRGREMINQVGGFHFSYLSNE